MEGELCMAWGSKFFPFLPRFSIKTTFQPLKLRIREGAVLSVGVFNRQLKRPQTLHILQVPRKWPIPKKIYEILIVENIFQIFWWKTSGGGGGERENFELC